LAEVMKCVPLGGAGIGQGNKYDEKKGMTDL
jgi:hypothetical protein